MLTFKGNVGDNLKELFVDIYSMNEVNPTNNISFEPGSLRKDKLLHGDQIMSGADGRVIERDSAKSECEVVTHTSDISNLEELQEIVDRSHEGVLPRSGNINVSLERIDFYKKQFLSVGKDPLGFCKFEFNFFGFFSTL
jgi:hypothetical protein